MLIAIIAIAVARSAARDLSSGERFEVASIKPRKGERVGPVPSLPDRFIRPDATLRDLIRYACELPTALQEQLGLRLDSVRGPVPVLTIERADLPTPD
jgi:hypothetical protein